MTYDNSDVRFSWERSPGATRGRKLCVHWYGVCAICAMLIVTHDQRGSTSRTRENTETGKGHGSGHERR